MFCPSLVHTLVLPTTLPQESPSSIGCFTVDICICLHCLVESHRGQLCVASVCKHNKVSLIVQELVFARGMRLSLGQALVGHSLYLCSIFALVHLVDKTYFGSKD